MIVGVNETHEFSLSWYFAGSGNFESIGQEFVVDLNGEPYMIHLVSIYDRFEREDGNWNLRLSDFTTCPSKQKNEDTGAMSYESYINLLFSYSKDKDRGRVEKCFYSDAIKRQLEDALKERMAKRAVDVLDQTMLIEMIRMNVLTAHYEMMIKVESRAHKEQDHDVLNRAIREGQKISEGMMPHGC